MQHQNQENNQQGKLITNKDIEHVSGGIGIIVTDDRTPIIEPVLPPRYITLAIGEDGGKLPDLLS